MYSTKYSSPIGEILLLSDGENLCGISFDSQKRDVDSIENDDLEIFKKVIGWLDDYFDGKNPKIDFNLKASGTDFRMKVWKLLSQIPYGETVTYGEIASMISPTMSAQAVGGAVGANPIAIVIPCHRVMGKDNKLTGYAAGLDKKIELLKIENGDDIYLEYCSNEKNRDIAAALEQSRWNGFMLSRGWESADKLEVQSYKNQATGSSHKHTLAKLHPFIREWDDLDGDDLKSILGILKVKFDYRKHPQETTRQSIDDTERFLTTDIEQDKTH